MWSSMKFPRKPLASQQLWCVQHMSVPALTIQAMVLGWSLFRTWHFRIHSPHPFTFSEFQSDRLVGVLSALDMVQRTFNYGQFRPNVSSIFNCQYSRTFRNQNSFHTKSGANSISLYYDPQVQLSLHSGDKMSYKSLVTVSDISSPLNRVNINRRQKEQ